MEQLPASFLSLGFLLLPHCHAHRLVALLACGMRPNVDFFAVTPKGRTALIDGLMA